jgi:sugar phosphate isomerase/epimerase
MAKTDNLKVIPVLDLPRLFVPEIFNNFDSLDLCLKIIEHMAVNTEHVILHLIDMKNHNHISRDSWCPVGRGLMPYKKIFDFAKQKNIHYDHWVLEYENKELTLESLVYLAS